MKEYKLSEISKFDLTGRWVVKDRIAKKKGVESFIGTHNAIELFEAGTFQAGEDEETYGTWTLVRYDDLIYNPQIIFLKNNLEKERAIITRFYAHKNKAGETATLILFFNENLEITFTKEGGV